MRKIELERYILDPINGDVFYGDFSKFYSYGAES